MDQSITTSEQHTEITVEDSDFNLDKAYEKEKIL